MVLSSQVVTLILTVLSLWLSAITYLIIKAVSTYKKLTTGIDKKDFSSVLSKIKSDLKKIDKKGQTLQSDINHINLAIKSHIQKVGFMRYNPFGNTGGDQSFCLALLDQHDTGILITSLHARDQTRIYTKEIIKGKTKDKQELSKEEIACIKQAQM